MKAIMLLWEEKPNIVELKLVKLKREKVIRKRINILSANIYLSCLLLTVKYMVLTKTAKIFTRIRRGSMLFSGM
jgi:hypothetical protein